MVEDSGTCKVTLGKDGIVVLEVYGLHTAFFYSLPFPSKTELARVIKEVLCSNLTVEFIERRKTGRSTPRQ